MWWLKNRTEEKSTRPRCPNCATHPVLVQSGYGFEKSLICPVCKTLFDNKGVRYDPDAGNQKDNPDTQSEEDMMQEQQELWDTLWGS